MKMAGLSATERKRKSRARQSEEEKNVNKIKAKNGMKALRLKRKGNDKYKKKENEASKLRMRKMRAKKKAESAMYQHTTATAYASPQALGKALRRVKKSLPSSPRKKTLVVEKLATHVGLITPSSKPERKNGLSCDTAECVKAFYYRDDISRQLPGKKDVKSVRNTKTNKKSLLQKRLLIYNLKDAFHIFKVDYPDIEIGLSKFCELRPSEVETVGCKDQQVCCCPYCENFAFLLKLCKWKRNNIKNVNDLLELIVCNKYNADCMKQKCKKCPSQLKKFIQEELCLDVEKVCVHQWNKGKLEEHTLKVKEFSNELILQLTNLFKHLYNLSCQAKELRRQKDSLLRGQLLMQIDFSQNYEIKHQNEVMAAHWKTNQDLSVTIYTAVIYFRRADDEDLETKSYAVISDCNRHTSAIVKIFNQVIIEDVKKNLTFNVDKMIIWSDGAASHFKNRYSMSLLFSDTIFCEWNFTASYHGKGPHDGIGAVLKRHVWKKVLQGQTIIKNAFEFFKEVDTANINIKCLFVEEKEILCVLTSIEKDFEKINELKGIQSCHCIKKADSSSVLTLNMFLNSGDSIPFKANISIQESRADDFSKNSATLIELEQYFSVYYDDNWYIGRVIEYNKKSETCKMKFLQETDFGFKWPSADDVQEVQKKFILSGPIELSGNLPFYIKFETRKEIIGLYKKFKKGLLLH